MNIPNALMLRIANKLQVAGNANLQLVRFRSMRTCLVARRGTRWFSGLWAAYCFLIAWFPFSGIGGSWERSENKIELTSRIEAQPWPIQHLRF
ncbi:MAG: hypothetical protein AAFN77_12010 [Planctomycetota bacterium]